MTITQIQTWVRTQDTSLLDDVLRGEECAMEQLFDRHSVAVYSVAKRILQDAPSAEDVMHDIFMQIWREPITFLQMDGDLGNILVVLSRNRSIVVLRDRVSKGLQVAAPVLDRDNKVERRSATAKPILTAPLPDEDFRALEMAFYKGYTVSEITQETGRSPQAVKKILCSALKALPLSITPQVATRQPVGGFEVAHASSRIS